MDKFSELKRRADKCPIKRFKAFIGKANTQATLCADTGIEIIGWSGFDASDLNAKSHRVELARFIAAADPETILSLLSELEAKDKRIAELEAKLATPVRLPDIRSDDYHETGWFQHMKYYRDVERSIRAARFAVGDE